MEAVIMDSEEMTQKQRLLESKRQGILDELDRGVVDLQFKKVNGDLRNMTATRDFSLIPEEKHPKSNISDKNTEIVTLFDLEVKDWRSFRVENLVEYRRRVNG